MNIVSFNVNGLRSILNKDLMNFINNDKSDIYCFQETKMQIDDSIYNVFKDYPFIYFNNAIKKGYSGTLIISKLKPLNVIYGINDEYNDEGRIITLEFNDFYLVNVYSPNSKKELLRLDYRMIFEDKLKEYLTNLKMKKNVILCGDLNVAHKEIDIKNPKNNLRSAGFTIEERTKFSELLESGFIDTFRYFYPDTIKYSWWSYMFNSRKNNAGWRIDYFVVNKEFISQIKDSEILNEIYGSDHCPIKLTIYENIN